MANVTFSSPRMGRDLTVYAVAGDRGTVLALAKAHKVPIPFDCEDGNCGSCLIEVEVLSPGKTHAIALTEKEKEMLRQLGKISRSEIEAAEIRDMPPRFRLACQTIVRDEDFIVRFAGDETLPERLPQPTGAARRFTGGLRLQSVEDFLAFAIEVEQDAARHFDSLAASMADSGNDEVATLFRQLAGYSRLHLAAARARAAQRHLPVELPAEYVWPDHVVAEHTPTTQADPRMTRLDGLRVALQGERRGQAFYLMVGAEATNADVTALAKEFAKEEAEHVRVLEGWVAREEWLARTHEVSP